MQNFQPGFFAKVFATAWKAVLKDRPLQLVAVKDIGHFAAQAFLHPDEYKGQAIGLAGDELTFAQAAEVYKKRTGKSIPLTFEFVAHAVLYAVSDLGAMYRWFYTDGYHVDIQALRKRHPGLQDLAKYLEESGI